MRRPSTLPRGISCAPGRTSWRGVGATLEDGYLIDVSGANLADGDECANDGELVTVYVATTLGRWRKVPRLMREKERLVLMPLRVR